MLAKGSHMKGRRDAQDAGSTPPSFAGVPADNRVESGTPGNLESDFGSVHGTAPTPMADRFLDDETLPANNPDPAMNEVTLFHWGLYDIRRTAGAVRLVPHAGDPDPSAIGLDQLDPSVLRLRVRRPAIRKGWLEGRRTDGGGARGREPFVEVPWGEALDLVAGEIAGVRRDFGNEAIFGGSYGWASAGRFHHAQSQIHRFLNAAGGFVRHVDSYSLGAARVLMPHVVASVDALQAQHTAWPLLAAHTELFVAFGGLPPKNAQTSSGGVGDHRLRAGTQAMAQAGVRFVNISPVRDNIEAGAAVEWIPIRPNTDAALMLALAYVVETEGLADADFLARHCVGYDRVRAYLLGIEDGLAKDPTWAQAITGVSARRIITLARDMASHRTMLNAAWSLQRADHGEQPYWALVTLAAMLGQIGTPGGGFGVGYGASNRIGSGHANIAGPTLPQGRNPVAAFIPVARIADLLLRPGETFTYNGARHTYPAIRLVYWAGGNPFHHHQDLHRLERAWDRPQTIIVHEQFWTATARRADIVLPATTALEREDIGYATREGVLVAMARAAEPVGEARDDYAIFTDLAARLGVEAAFTEGLDADGWLRRLYAETAAKAEKRHALPDYEDFRRRGVVRLGPSPEPVIMFEAFRRDPQAHPLPTPSGRIELFSERIAGFALPDCPGHAAWMPPREWLGAAETHRHPLHLLSDQPTRRLHSQLDHAAYSLAGKIGGREPVFLNAADALARGIGPGDTVVISNDRGRCLAAAVPSGDIAPGVARLATGAWYEPDAEGTDQRGNPNVLTLDEGASGLSQGCMAQTCLVEIARAGADVPPVPSYEPPAFAGR